MPIGFRLFFLMMFQPFVLFEQDKAFGWQQPKVQDCTLLFKLTASTWGYKNVTLQTTKVAFFSSLLIKHGHIVIEFSCSFKIKIYPICLVFFFKMVNIIIIWQEFKKINIQHKSLTSNLNILHYIFGFNE